MRYALLIVDGAADYPLPELSARTPLMAAKKPAMDFIARNGFAGQAANIPPKMSPGSDVAALSILGYDPTIYYSGRAPLEAAAQRISLAPTETVFRANTVILHDGAMTDFAGGHPRDEDVFPFIDYLAENLQIPGVKIFRGVSYRHLCVIDNLMPIPATTPPHDISGKIVAPYLPKDSAAAEILNLVMRRSEELLAVKKDSPFTGLWLWGGGKMPQLPSFKEKFNLRGGMISAVDLLRGIAVLTGLEIIAVPGATGFYDTNYCGKGENALKFLRNHDFVAVHVEAPDEAGHNGELNEKIRAIENFDRFIAAPLLAEAQKNDDLRILILPDHRTPLSLRTHSSEPVPFALFGKGVELSPMSGFDESAMANKPVVAGKDLLNLLFA